MAVSTVTSPGSLSSTAAARTARSAVRASARGRMSAIATPERALVTASRVARSAPKAASSSTGGSGACATSGRSMVRRSPTCWARGSRAPGPAGRPCPEITASGSSSREVARNTSAVARWEEGRGNRVLCAGMGPRCGARSGVGSGIAVTLPAATWHSAAMAHWVCLLRAVNLGARNKVPMPALREALSEAGFTEVRTLRAERQHRAQLWPPQPPDGVRRGARARSRALRRRPTGRGAYGPRRSTVWSSRTPSQRPPGNDRSCCTCTSWWQRRSQRQWSACIPTS
jgi:hypothetical protein